MSNGSSNTLPWVLTFISGALGAAAVGFVLGRYTAPEVPAAAAPQQQAAQDPNALPPGASSEQVGDWTLACQEVGEGKKSCVALQTPKNAAGQMVAAVLAGYDNQAQRVFVVSAPLGVALEKGLEFTMPGEKAEVFGFGACNRATCDAQLSVADDGFAKMEAAGSFEIAYTTLSGERIAANVSMKGLADAFTRIEKPAVAPAAEPAPAAAAAPATEPATPPAEQPAATPDNQ